MPTITDLLNRTRSFRETTGARAIPKNDFFDLVKDLIAKVQELFDRQASDFIGSVDLSGTPAVYPAAERGWWKIISDVASVDGGDLDGIAVKAGGQLVCDGVVFTYVENPETLVNGLVESGNNNATSGGTIYDFVQKRDSLISENSPNITGYDSKIIVDVKYNLLPDDDISLYTLKNKATPTYYAFIGVKVNGSTYFYSDNVVKSGKSWVNIYSSGIIDISFLINWDYLSDKNIIFNEGNVILDKTYISSKYEDLKAAKISIDKTETYKKDKTGDWFTESGYIHSGGYHVASETRKHTDFIDIRDVEAITIRGLSASFISLISFYDFNNVFISSIFGPEYNETETRIDKSLFPENAVYARCTGSGDGNDYLYIISDYGTQKKIDNKIAKTSKNNALLDLSAPDSTYVHVGSGVVTDGAGIFVSKTIVLSDENTIRYNGEVVSSVSPIKGITFLDSEGNVDSYFVDFNAETVKDVTVERPPTAHSVVIAWRVGKLVNITIGSGDKVDDTLKRFEFNKSYSKALDIYNSFSSGVFRLGAVQMVSNVPNPSRIIRQSYYGTSYLDVNATKEQFSLLNSNGACIPENILNKLPAEEIDFTPANDGFVRIIVGKDDEDVFYVAYIPSNRKGVVGNLASSVLQKTTDFVTFTDVWCGDSDSANHPVAFSLTNYSSIRVRQVFPLANGELFVAAEFKRDDVSSDDGSGNTRYNEFSGYFVINSSRDGVRHCSYTDLNNVSKEMNTSRVISGSSYGSQIMYDWSISIHNNVILCSEYGGRTEAGAVWYSEDFGATFKQVFWMPNHYNEGRDDINVTETHIHGVMYDHYKKRMYVIAGEQNSNLFWSDDGLNTDDATSWNVEDIKHQHYDPHVSYYQLVNGYPFRNCIVYGSDFANKGAFMRVNRMPDSEPQEIEVGREILPMQWSGTYYCAGSMFRRDEKSPVLMTITRENSRDMLAEDEEHHSVHLARVIATYNGYDFFEIWKDDTYGDYSSYDLVADDYEVRGFAKCGRDMKAYQLKNGDIVIKYIGRDYIYVNGASYDQRYVDFPSQVKIIKNSQKFF